MCLINNITLYIYEYGTLSAVSVVTPLFVTYIIRLVTSSFFRASHALGNQHVVQSHDLRVWWILLFCAVSVPQSCFFLYVTEDAEQCRLQPMTIERFFSGLRLVQCLIVYCQ